MPGRSKPRKTPACAMPRAKPPPNASPIRGAIDVSEGPKTPREVIPAISQQSPGQSRALPVRISAVAELQDWWAEGAINRVSLETTSIRPANRSSIAETPLGDVADRRTLVWLGAEEIYRGVRRG